MAGRIVVFGATGYTGALTARALVAQGARPVLAGRNRTALAELADELGGLEIAYADAEEPRSVRALVERDDVLVTTVGPFLRYGHAAVEAAVDAGAHYLDSTGEPPFIREVFESYGPRATRSALITAFGYDYVPGNLAAGLALDRVGDDGFRVDIGYFVGGGDLWRGLTASSLQSVAGVATARMYTFRGRIHEERRPRVREFQVGGRSRVGLSIGASEHFALPASYPALYEVNVYLGWFGRATRLAARGRIGAFGARAALATLARLARRRSGKSTLTSRIVAVAYDSEGSLLTDVHLSGGDPYEFTAGALSWAACQASRGMVETGAMGPVAAFGLAELEAGCAMAGIARVTG
ncbi:saccharopine dehydrogenase NADP-binding domain-containing protein [Actinoallomurus sp. NBC_01490]|uniref:saccharopine dehydrogenase family protein n=1 Tax=Actinoallomurus sp. NBC_01490 TaxID=2903557 RepID=UPI002E3243D6|nr:saccharopine dehydrogenase NADP-binding domain-containing protein [Actinoallomurus sp. NBC_01490]